MSSLNPVVTVYTVCYVNNKRFFSVHALLSACVLAVFFFFPLLCFLCICVGLPVLYNLVVKAASIDRYSCLSDSLPLLFLNACAILCVLRRINTVQFSSWF